jgi:hypothetical protein
VFVLSCVGRCLARGIFLVVQRLVLILTEEFASDLGSCLDWEKLVCVR